ncbi:uncharacterized protein BO80DRAFT_167292 [Aspergillus ibericus CBS 121593]|uniref:Uncharacterized protein n=1 Tax=Aspergillus ibericus CBS 121593 TaxID=1448316 RepID=A0A395GR18_9EURO|nr:hypothetical protein BO80DRAFT_167292 [Aspergillus ibericus CBS 121593]RAK97991.1 hypothetical protein BO80DRAFT_167292 [Aspergillus ibericus CBS 121593]
MVGDAQPWFIMTRSCSAPVLLVLLRLRLLARLRRRKIGGGTSHPSSIEAQPGWLHGLFYLALLWPFRGCFTAQCHAARPVVRKNITNRQPDSSKVQPTEWLPMKERTETNPSQGVPGVGGSSGAIKGTDRQGQASIFRPCRTSASGARAATIATTCSSSAEMINYWLRKTKK